MGSCQSRVGIQLGLVAQLMIGGSAMVGAQESAWIWGLSHVQDRILSQRDWARDRKMDREAEPLNRD